jgi:hypothetical protein
MATKPVDCDSRGELSLATDALADLVFSMTLSREAELVDEAEAGFPVQTELDVVRALLRPNVRMPLSRPH